MKQTNESKSKIHKIVTVGYEGKAIKTYIRHLKNASVTLLCDVRRNPISRKPGFSKRTLAEACFEAGIRYEHVPSLGIDSSARKALKTDQDYQELFREYKKSQLPMQGDALSLIGSWMEGGDVVALTCFENLPRHCHRHCVADALVSLLGKKYTILNL